MRVTSETYSEIMLQALADNKQKTADAMMRISTGKRILRPSDDPTGAASLSCLDRYDSRLTEYANNTRRLRSTLQINEGHLSAITASMTAAKNTLIGVNSADMTHDQLTAAASALDSLHQQIEAETNKRNENGNYLFSGTTTDKPAVTYEPNEPVGQRYTWTGNTQQQYVTVGDNLQKASNTTLEEMADVLNKLDAAADAMRAPAAGPADQAVKSALTAAEDALDATATSVNTKIAIGGHTQQELDLIDSTNGKIRMALQVSAQDVGATDQATVSIQLKEYQTAIEGAQLAYSSVMKSSIFDVLFR